MKNSQTRYNAYNLPCLGVMLVLIAASYFIDFEGSFATSTLLFGVAAGSFFGSRKTMQCDVELYEKTLRVIQEAARGNLEPRVVNIDPNQPMAPIALGINDLLDQMEALMRETKTSIESASQGKTYRNIFNEGFRGLFAINARYISEGVHGVVEQCAQFAFGIQLVYFTETVEHNHFVVDGVTHNGQDSRNKCLVDFH